VALLADNLTGPDLRALLLVTLECFYAVGRIIIVLVP
jgi:hypothetical protein